MIECPNCRRRFRWQSDLQRHQSRKRPCHPVLPAKDIPEEIVGDPTYCIYCRRKFCQVGTRNRHQKICPIANTEDGRRELFEQLHRDRISELECRVVADAAKNEQEIVRMRQEIIELRATLLVSRRTRAADAADAAAIVDASAARVIGAAASAGAGGTATAIVDARSINISVPIMLHPFGMEDLSTMTTEHVLGRIKEHLREELMPVVYSKLNLRHIMDHDFQPASLESSLDFTRMLYKDIYQAPGNSNAYTLKGVDSKFVVFTGQGSGWDVCDEKLFVDAVKDRVGDALEKVDAETRDGAGGDDAFKSLTEELDIPISHFRRSWSIISNSAIRDDICARHLANKLRRFLSRYKSLLLGQNVRVFVPEAGDAQILDLRPPSRELAPLLEADLQAAAAQAAGQAAVHYP